MKTILFIFSVLLLCQINAQKLETVYTNEKQVVAMFFPDEIQQAVVGSPNFTFSYNKENPQHVGLLQGVKGTESNLLVITSSDEVFSYILKYRKSLDTLTYFIAKQERIGLEKPVNIIVLQNKVPTKTDSVFAKSSKVDSNYRAQYFEKFSSYHLEHNRNSLKKKRKNGIVLQLKDLVYDRTEVYAIVEIKNKSTIDFEVDYIKIFKVNGNMRRKSSYQKIEMEPIYKHYFPETIRVGESQSFVLVVPKFTLGDSESILVELKERNGARGINLKN
ncbi:MAG: DUF4138 domain-containing protein [Saonia sp.]